MIYDLRLWMIVGSGIIFGVFSTLAVRGFAVTYGIVDPPNPLIPQHKEPVAYLGGVAVFLGLVGTVLLGQLFDVSFVPTLAIRIRYTIGVAAVSFLLLGIIDDLCVLSPIQKLVGQILIAFGAGMFGVVHAFTGFALVDICLSVIWIVCIVNAMNLTDVCDGLVAGLVLILCLFMACVCPALIMIAMALAGVLFGFLVFNLPPASIFLGDAGSHFLGFLASAMLLLYLPQNGSLTSSTQIILLAGVPLFELIFLIVTRTNKGLPFWRGSPDHFSLRLQAAGLSRTQTNLVAWVVAAMLCIIAVLVEQSLWWQQVIVLSIVIGILIACGRLLIRWEVKPGAVQTSTQDLTTN